MKRLELIGFDGYYLVPNGIHNGLKMSPLYILSVIYDLVFLQVLGIESMWTGTVEC